MTKIFFTIDIENPVLHQLQYLMHHKCIEM